MAKGWRRWRLLNNRWYHVMVFNSAPVTVAYREYTLTIQFFNAARNSISIQVSLW